VSATPVPVFSEPSFAGIHNTDLVGSTARIIEGGSWKKQDMVILLPAARTVAMKCVMSWLHMITPPNQAAHRWPTFMWLKDMEVGEAYSTAIETVLSHPQLSGVKYLLTIEHDNAPPSDGIIKLLRHAEMHPEFACIGGLYWTKGQGGCPQIWGDPKDPILNFRPQPPDPKGGLVECCGTGMGFNLWSLAMFRDSRLRKPWFKTIASAEEGVGTQDLYFWGDARKFGYRAAVACDVLVGHHDVASDTMW
jgi:hypothetical protein